MKIVFVETTSPAGKLADAEIHFTDGPFAGLKWIGFGIWERRPGIWERRSGRNVTFPARTYAVNGERRSFALIRPTGNDQAAASDRLRDLILTAYQAHEDGKTSPVQDVADAIDQAEKTAPPLAEAPFTLDRQTSSMGAPAPGPRLW